MVYREIKVQPVAGNIGAEIHGVGLRTKLSDVLLQMLYAHLAKPENVVRFNWRTHSIAFWDNRCTQHYAINDYHTLRVMHRVTICGERPS